VDSLLLPINAIKSFCLVDKDYRFKVHSKNEIFNSISSGLTKMQIERKENATTWLYEALQQYAGPNWQIGNQFYICLYMTGKFDENYGRYWTCVTNSDNSNTIYSWTTYDFIEGHIEFQLSDGLAVRIFKSPGKFVNSKLS
jgi:hypothetical protein